LSQPAKALQNYQAILKREAELGTNASPGLKAIVEMARWRADFVQWQGKAETANRLPPQAAARTAAAAPSTPANLATP
ncbi:MAG TPA: hypothetical protein VNZ22_22890, partial [Bacillota bacterium]|nr:hypothetical protein [Bacillota bacterium]